MIKGGRTKIKRFSLDIVFGLISMFLLNCSSTLPWLENLSPEEKTEAKKIYWGIKVIASEEEFKEFEEVFIIAGQKYPAFPFLHQPLKDWWDTFWKRRDVDPTTEENESKEEWERRVEYAITHFPSVFGLCPWDDRGETYIKFGEADDVEKIITVELEIEKWHYFSRNLILIFESSIKTFGFEIKRDYKDPEAMIRASINWSKVQRDRFAYFPPDLELLPCAMQIVKFPEEMVDSTGTVQTKYDVYTNLLIPLKELGIVVDSLDSLYEYTLLQRIQILNENKKMIKGDTSLITRRMREELRGNLLVLQKHFELYPGTYTIYFSIQDTVTKKIIGYTRENYLLVEYAQAKETETISQLLLASKIMPARPEDEIFVRNDLLVVPMPGLTFFADQSIFPYYEIYDLKVNNEGKIKIVKEYYLYNDKREDKLFSDTLTLPADINTDILSSFSETDIYFAEELSAEKIIFMKNSGKSSLKKLPTYIKNGKFKKGEYILVIRIIDLNDNSDKRERKTLSGFKII